MTYVVGLTGGIGSGKSAVSELFQKKGVTVIDADEVSRQVVMPQSQALSRIAHQFGPSVLLPDGTLDRAALRKIIFGNADAKRWLEELLHPLITADIKAQLAASQTPYTVLVSPLLIETGQDKLADRVLLVDAPEALQLERTAKRDRVTQNEVQAIIKTQTGRDIRQAKADDVILNDKDLAHLSEAVDKLHIKYLNLSHKI